MSGKHRTMRSATDIGTQISSDVKIVQRLSLGMQIVSASIMIGSLVGAIGVGLNFIVVPGSDVLQQSAGTTTATGQPFYSQLWWPFQARYETTVPPYYAVSPSTPFDTQTIVDIGASTMVAGRSYNSSEITQLLNWAQTNNQKVDFDDQTLFGYIGGNIPVFPSLNGYIDSLVSSYGSHAGLGGWYVANEPEWLAGTTGVMREGVYARYAQVVSRLKQQDPNHRVYASSATLNKLRFCREGQPSLFLNSGFSYLRPPTVTDTSQAFQDQISRHIANFDVDYLCTDNWNIPFAYSLAGSYWAGDVHTAEELRMYAYTLLAHGGQGIEWFPYSTVGGLVWDNQVPTRTLNFANWLPSVEGGKIYLNSSYANGATNVTLAADATQFHTGAYAARMDISGSVNNYFNLRVYPPIDAKPPWTPRFHELATSTQYTLTGWVRSTGDAQVRLRANNNIVTFQSSPELVGPQPAWTQLSLTFTTPAARDSWTFGPEIVTATNGSVWFDDIELVQAGQTENLLVAMNPGFETVTGVDRSPHEPLYSTVKQLNSELAALGPVLSGAKRIAAFSDQNVPSKGLVSAVSSTVTQGLPRVEVGVFTSADVDGNYSLVLVNRNISSAANVALSLNTPGNLQLENLLDSSLQTVSASGGLATWNTTLAAGEGRVLRVHGLRYNAPIETSAYGEDFEDSQAQGWINDGGTWSVVDDAGNQVYDVQAGAGEVRGVATAQTFGDFEYNGKFKIMPDHNPASVIYFTFRKDPATSINTNKYDLRVKLDPGAEDTNGFVEIGRRDLGSTTYSCRVNDENFLQGSRYIDFRIRGYGNTIEAFLDGIKYFTCIDSTAGAFTNGQVGLRLDAGSHVRLDDISVNSLSVADQACTENWLCGEWSSCSNNQQSRVCSDQNACGTTFQQPPLTQSCSANTNTNTNTNTNVNANANSNTNAPVCTEHWNCTAWSVCANDQQSRTCTDTNACGTTVNKPLLTQSCSTTPPPPVSTCLTDWQCGAWSACDAQNRQQRHCVEANQCPNTGQASAFDDLRACNANTGGPDDLTPPETTVPTVDPTIYSDVVQLALSGRDNVTTPANLRFTYRVDGGQARVAPAGPILLVRDLGNGEHSVIVQSIDEAGNADPTPATITFTVKKVLSIVTAPRGRAPTDVRTFDYLGRLRSRFTAFPGLSTGASVAVLDVEGDGTGEIAVAPGRGGPPEVRIFTAKGKFLRKFNVFPKGFSGGTNLAAADLTGDGIDELIAAQASGTGSFVRVFTSKGRLLAETSVLGTKFRGGVSVAAGHMSSSGAAEIIIAPASNGQPVYAQYRLANGKLSLVRRVRLPVTAKTVGATLAIEDLDNWGDAEIVASVSAAKQSTQFFVLSSAGSRLATVTAPNKQRGAVSLAAGDLRSFDNHAEVVTANADAVTTRVNVFTSPNASIRVSRQVTTFTPYPSRRWGLNVVVGHL